jgi:glutamate-1-semialdehyde aminotransferase
LDIYRAEPVADHVRNHGVRLRQGIDRICGELGVDATCVGPPFRSTLVFAGPDDELARRRRTLYFQELLKFGVMTYKGFMLPSYAHGDEALHFLLEGAGRALECLVRAERSGNLDRAIEIPLL